jgi:hypothetical protein
MTTTLKTQPKPLPPLPPTWRATISLGNYRVREQRRSELLPCEREEA